MRKNPNRADEFGPGEERPCYYKDHTKYGGKLQPCKVRNPAGGLICNRPENHNGLHEAGYGWEATTCGARWKRVEGERRLP